MSAPDSSVAFLNSLPELPPGESFSFRCHPDVACFNACCADLRLMLTPLDVLLLRRQLSLSSQDFIAAYADQSAAPDTGLPMLFLRMDATKPNRPCPFVRATGCFVYPGRPGACRTYPLGRAARIGDSGELIEQFFIVREDHCQGFLEDGLWTSGEWLADQGLAALNASNDRYLRLSSLIRAKGAMLTPKQANMAFLSLYNLDSFQAFIRDVDLFSRVSAAPGRREEVLSDEAKALDFGYDWLELTLCGRAGAIGRKP